METSENLKQSFTNLTDLVDNNLEEILRQLEEENIPENHYTKELPIKIEGEKALSDYEVLSLIKERTEGFNIEFLEYLKQAIIDWGEEFIEIYFYVLFSYLDDIDTEKASELKEAFFDKLENSAIYEFSDSYRYTYYSMLYSVPKYFGDVTTNRYLKALQGHYERGGITDCLLLNIDKILEEIDNKINTQTEEPDTDPIDLSDTDTKTKLAMLDELGVLDYIRKSQPLGISTNKLATLLSAILGINSSTLQPALNAMRNKNTDQKSAPKEIHYTKARLKLTELGYMPKEN